MAKPIEDRTHPELVKYIEDLRVSLCRKDASISHYKRRNERLEQILKDQGIKIEKKPGGHVGQPEKDIVFDRMTVMTEVWHHLKREDTDIELSLMVVDVMMGWCDDKDASWWRKMANTKSLGYVAALAVREAAARYPSEDYPSALVEVGSYSLRLP